MKIRIIANNQRENDENISHLIGKEFEAKPKYEDAVVIKGSGLIIYHDEYEVLPEAIDSTALPQPKEG